MIKKTIISIILVLLLVILSTFSVFATETVTSSDNTSVESAQSSADSENNQGQNTEIPKSIIKYAGKFSGNRVFNLKINASSSDLPENGLKKIIEEAIKNNKPEGAEFSYSVNVEPGLLIGYSYFATITIPFSSFDDYKSKMEKLYSAHREDFSLGNEKEKPLIITYVDNPDSPFFSGRYYGENATVTDYFYWLIKGLEYANLEVPQYIVGDYTLNIDGKKKMSSKDSEFSIFGNSDEDENLDQIKGTGMDKCNIQTEVLADGTFSRTITLSANNDTYQTLLQSSKLDCDSYFEKLANELSKEVTYNKTADNQFRNYVFKIAAKNEAEIIENTNKIFKNENTVFTYSMSPNKENGRLHVHSDYYVDTNYYCNGYHNNNEASEVTFTNIFFGSSNTQKNMQTSEEYYTEDTDIITENDVLVKLSFVSKDVAKFTFVITPVNTKMPGEVNKAFEESLSKAVKNRGEISKNGASYYVSFQGTEGELNTKISDFLGQFNSEEDELWSSFNIEKAITPDDSSAVYRVNISLDSLMGKKKDFTVDISEDYSENFCFIKEEIGFMGGALPIDDSAKLTDTKFVNKAEYSSDKFYIYYHESTSGSFFIIISIIAGLIIAGVVIYIIVKRKKTNKKETTQENDNYYNYD